MKTMCNKILSMMVLIVLVMNCIGSSVLAVTETPTPSPSTGTSGSKENPGDKVGDPTAKKQEKDLMEKQSKTLSDYVGDVADGIIGVATLGLRILVVTLATGLRGLATAVAHSTGEVDESYNMVTPDEILFNQLAITDINFFQGDTFGVGNNKKTLEGKDNPVKAIRKAIANWYYALRVIAIIFLLIALIYVGVRLAAATVAEDRAKYKKWIWNWLLSMCILFVLHYLIITIISVNNSFVEILFNAKEAAFHEDNDTFFNYTTGLAIDSITTVLSGIEAWSYLITYVAIVVLTFIFLIMYIRRMITVAFLILISPIITITYSIDKLGDGKSQALNTWFRKFMEAVLIQPFHCIIYIVFVATAAVSIAKLGTVASGFFTVLCLGFTLKAESIVKDIFGFRDRDINGNSMGAAAGLAYGVYSSVGNKMKQVGNKGKAKSNESKNVGSATGNVNKGTSTSTPAAKPSNQSRTAENNSKNVDNNNKGQTPIYGPDQSVIKNVPTNGGTNQTDSGIILPGTAEYRQSTVQFNEQLRNGTLAQGGTINDKMTSVIAQTNGGRILTPNGNGVGGLASNGNGIGNLASNESAGSGIILGPNGQPLTSGNSQTVQTPVDDTTRTQQMAQNEVNEASNAEPSNEGKRTITKPKSTWKGKAWSTFKAVNGLGAAMGIIGATSAYVSDKGAAEVGGAAVAGYMAGNAVQDKVGNAVQSIKTKRHQRKLATSYRNYKEENNLDDDQMAQETQKFRNMNSQQINQMAEGSGKRYAKSLHAMKSIFDEQSEDNDESNEKFNDTLGKIKSGEIEPDE